MADLDAADPLSSILAGVARLQKQTQRDLPEVEDILREADGLVWQAVEIAEEGIS